MTTTLTRRAPQAVVEQRRAARRRLITWRRLRAQAHARWCAAFNAIDNNATDEGNEPATQAYLRYGRVFFYAQGRIRAAIDNDRAASESLIAAVRSW
ncbi:MAG: hypothetical protein RLZZ459_1112 [Cyanobacteriota bacterium]|jgi:hypothetical protein